jgi:hypothetical protein
MLQADRRDVAELVEMRAQGVHQLDPLRDRLLADAEHHGAGLLFGAFGLDETHVRPGRGLGDCLGVGRIILLPLDVGGDVLRRDHLHGVTQRCHLPRPVMRARTGFHRHYARRLRRHEPLELQTRELLAKYGPPVRRGTVQLEHVLCQINPDDGNFFHGCRLLSCLVP